MRPDIFISYGRGDQARVEPVVRALEGLGWKVWWDPHLPTGPRFDETIDRALAEARAAIVFWSKESIASPWVRDEADDADRQGKLIHVLLDAVIPPKPFGRCQHVDLTDGLDSARLRQLAQGLVRYLGLPPRQTRKKAPAPSAPRADEDALDEVAEPARTARPRLGRPALGVAAALVVAFAATWAWKVHAGDPDRRTYRLQGLRPSTGPVEYEVDAATGCKVPVGWEILDATKGTNDWAVSVREPRSGAEFRLVEPGSFLMGSPEDEEGREEDETQHLVHLTRPYYLATHEFTRGAAMRVAEVSPGLDWELPVSNFDWPTARQYCHEIGCELPTEAQWEFAARAGSTERFSWGADLDGGKGRGNVRCATGGGSGDGFPFTDDHPDGLAPVGRYEPNALGFHDMTGNVREWCLDEYTGDYGPGECTDPWPTPTGRPSHVLRGGSHRSLPEHCRVACRWPFDSKTSPHDEVGFRPALTLE